MTVAGGLAGQDTPLWTEVTAGLVAIPTGTTAIETTEVLRLVFGIPSIEPGGGGGGGGGGSGRRVSIKHPSLH